MLKKRSGKIQPWQGVHIMQFPRQLYHVSTGAKFVPEILGLVKKDVEELEKQYFTPNEDRP